MKAQVKNDQLLRALNNATLFKGDDARPLLQSTEMTFVDATTIRFVTTDSFALLHETVEAEVPEEMVGQTRLVNLIDAKPMLAALKANDKFGATLIELGNDKVSVTFEEIGSRATFVQKVEGTFPNWQMLVKEWDGVKESPTLGIGLWQLARLAKLRPVEAWKSGDHDVAGGFEIIDNLNPIRVTIGHAIWVMVMPVKLP
jgi:hypothetical protein